MYLTEKENNFILLNMIIIFFPVFLNINFHELSLLEEPPDALKLFCLCTSACYFYDIIKYMRFCLIFLPQLQHTTRTMRAKQYNFSEG